MLDEYYVRPQAVDRIRASWIGSEIECYVVWLAEQSYSRASVRCRVPVLFAFGEFAWAGGARSVGDLPAHVDAFVAERVPEHRAAQLGAVAARERVKNVRGPIEQMLRLVVPGFTGSRRSLLEVPFIDELPGFFEYLLCERGLRPTSLHGYECYLRSFERYLGRVGVKQLVELSPALISMFVAERSAGLAMASVGLLCGALRGFLRYAYREGVLASDLSKTVDRPRTYRLSDIPRSISPAEVSQVLACVDRSSTRGKRDYAALLLLATYGLRSREIAALTLDHIDWRRGRLSVPGRKGGHSTAFPLSSSVGEALVDYLQARPPAERGATCVLHGVRSGAADQPHGGLQARHEVSAEGRDPGPPSRLSHPAPQLRATTRRRRLLAEDDRRLRGASLPEDDRDLHQGGRRVVA